MASFESFGAHAGCHEPEYLLDDSDDQDGQPLLESPLRTAYCDDHQEKQPMEVEDQEQQPLMDYDESFPNEASGLEAEPLAVGTPKDVAEKCVFFFKGNFFLRLFKAQMKPKPVGTVYVGGDTVEDVFDVIWGVAKKHVMRQVVFENDKPKWAEKQFPERDDMDMFIRFNDPSKKRSLSVSAVTPKIITSWRGKIINTYLHAYSISVETSTQHQLVLRTLIAPIDPDRSGAHSTRDVAALAKYLKETHPHLEAHHSSWIVWANWIHCAEAHKQEELKKEPAPPLDYAKLFRWTNVSESARLQSIYRGVTEAQTVNGGWLRDIKEICDGLSSAMAILTVVVQKVDTLVAKGSAGEELITAMEAAVRPEETELSRTLAKNISDCPDIDH